MCGEGSSVSVLRLHLLFSVGTGDAIGEVAVFSRVEGM